MRVSEEGGSQAEGTARANALGQDCACLDSKSREEAREWAEWGEEGARWSRAL